jgi:hypothetical protein
MNYNGSKDEANWLMNTGMFTKVSERIGKKYVGNYQS